MNTSFSTCTSEPTAHFLDQHHQRSQPHLTHPKLAHVWSFVYERITWNPSPDSTPGHWLDSLLPSFQPRSSQGYLVDPMQPVVLCSLALEQQDDGKPLAATRAAHYRSGLSWVSCLPWKCRSILKQSTACLSFRMGTIHWRLVLATSAVKTKRRR